jgi:hypothetical protein
VVAILVVGGDMVMFNFVVDDVMMVVNGVTVGSW